MDDTKWKKLQFAKQKLAKFITSTMSIKGTNLEAKERKWTPKDATNITILESMDREQNTQSFPHKKLSADALAGGGQQATQLEAEAPVASLLENFAMLNNNYNELVEEFQSSVANQEQMEHELHDLRDKLEEKDESMNRNLELLELQLDGKERLLQELRAQLQLKDREISSLKAMSQSTVGPQRRHSEFAAEQGDSNALHAANMRILELEFEVEQFQEKEAALKELGRRCRHLETRCAGLLSEGDSLKEELAYLQKNYTEATEELEASKAQILALKSQPAFNPQWSLMEDALTILKDEITKLDTQNTPEEQLSIGKLVEILAESQKQISKSKILEEENSELEKRLDELLSQLSLYSKENNAMRERIGSIDKELLEKPDDASLIPAELKDLKEQLGLLQQSHSNNELQLLIANKENAEYKEQISQLNLISKEQSRKVSQLEMSLADLTEKLLLLENNLAEKEGQISQLNIFLAEKEGQISHLNIFLAEKEGQISHSNIYLAKLQQEADGYKSKNMILENDLYLLRQSNFDTSQLTEQLAQLKVDCARLNEDLDRKQHEVTQVLEEVAPHFTQPIKDKSLYQVIAAFRAHYEECALENEELRKSRDFIRSEAVQNHRELVLLQELLKKDVEEANSRIAQLSRENADMKAKVHVGLEQKSSDGNEVSSERRKTKVQFMSNGDSCIGLSKSESLLVSSSEDLVEVGKSDPLETSFYFDANGSSENLPSELSSELALNEIFQQESKESMEQKAQFPRNLTLELEAKVSQLELEVEKRSLERTGLQQRAASLEQENETVKSERLEIRNQLILKEAQVEALQNEVNSLKQDKEAVLLSINSIKSDLYRFDELAGQLTSFERGIRDFVKMAFDCVQENQEYLEKEKQAKIDSLSAELAKERFHIQAQNDLIEQMKTECKIVDDKLQKYSELTNSLAPLASEIAQVSIKMELNQADMLNWINEARLKIGEFHPIFADEVAIGRLDVHSSDSLSNLSEDFLADYDEADAIFNANSVVLDQIERLSRITAQPTSSEIELNEISTSVCSLISFSKAQNDFILGRIPSILEEIEVIVSKSLAAKKTKGVSNSKLSESNLQKVYLAQLEEIKLLQNEIMGYSQRIADYSIKLEDMKQLKYELEEKLAFLENEKWNLKLQNSMLENQVLNLKGEVADAQKEIENIKESQRQKILEIYREFEETIQIKMDLEEEIKNANDMLQSQILDLKERIKELEENVEGLISKNKELDEMRLEWQYRYEKSMSITKDLEKDKNYLQAVIEQENENTASLARKLLLTESFKSSLLFQKKYLIAENCQLRQRYQI